jgi:hypothetical protein
VPRGPQRRRDPPPASPPLGTDREPPARQTQRTADAPRRPRTRRPPPSPPVQHHPQQRRVPGRSGSNALSVPIRLLFPPASTAALSPDSRQPRASLSWPLRRPFGRAATSRAAPASFWPATNSTNPTSSPDHVRPGSPSRVGAFRRSPSPPPPLVHCRHDHRRASLAPFVRRRYNAALTTTRADAASSARDESEESSAMDRLQRHPPVNPDQHLMPAHQVLVSFRGAVSARPTPMSSVRHGRGPAASNRGGAIP